MIFLTFEWVKRRKKSLNMYQICIKYFLYIYIKICYYMETTSLYEQETECLGDL